MKKRRKSILALCAGATAYTYVVCGGELGDEDQALLRDIVVANQRLEAALPLSSFFCEYVHTCETVSEFPQRGRRYLMQKVRGKFAFERGDDGTIDKLAVEKTFLDAKTEPVVEGARPFQPGDVTKFMRLGNIHYSLMTTGGTQTATRGSGPKDTFKARRYSPWNMLFDFKAEPLTQLDTPEEIKCMVSIDQFYVGPGRVTALRRREQDGQPLVELDVDFSGQDKQTGAEMRTLYTLLFGREYGLPAC